MKIVSGNARLGCRYLQSVIQIFRGDFKRVVTSEANLFVSYADPMDNPAAVSYIMLSACSPELLKEHPGLRFVATILFVLTGSYPLGGIWNDSS